MIFKFSSECVGCGHPDKVCDAIADAILDEALKQDPHSFMAVEATIKDNFVLIYGEANSKATLDYASIAKDTLKKAGYDQMFDIMVKVGQQSCQINHAVTNGKIAAGDQGMMLVMRAMKRMLIYLMDIYWHVNWPKNAMNLHSVNIKMYCKRIVKHKLQSVMRIVV